MASFGRSGRWQTSTPTGLSEDVDSLSHTSEVTFKVKCGGTDRGKRQPVIHGTISRSCPGGSTGTLPKHDRSAILQLSPVVWRSLDCLATSCTKGASCLLYSRLCCTGCDLEPGETLSAALMANSGYGAFPAVSLELKRRIFDSGLRKTNAPTTDEQRQSPLDGYAFTLTSPNPRPNYIAQGNDM